MPETVDDFMKRFGGDGTIDDSEAQQYHDRFVSTQADDRDFDNQTYHQSATEYLGKLPDDKFQEAARNVYSQAAPTTRTWTRPPNVRPWRSTRLNPQASRRVGQRL